MSFIDYTYEWLEQNRGALARGGALSVSDSAETRPKRVVYIAVQGTARFAEIILWETGEAEFGFGANAGEKFDEHHDLIDTAELGQLLARFLARVKEFRP